jgi:Na+-driven multidrug efflux pump
MMFCFSIILGFSNGFQPVAGFNWGARRYDRVRGSFRFASRTAFLGGLVMAVITGAFAPQIIRWFSSGDAELIRLGTLCIRLQAAALPIHAWVAIVNSMAAGLGKARIALLLATARQGSCFIPVLYPLSRFFGAEGIASVQAVADVLTLALAIPALLSIRRMIREAEEQDAERRRYPSEESR